MFELIYFFYFYIKKIIFDQNVKTIFNKKRKKKVKYKCTNQRLIEKLFSRIIYIYLTLETFL